MRFQKDFSVCRLTGIDYCCCCCCCLTINTFTSAGGKTGGNTTKGPPETPHYHNVCDVPRRGFRGAFNWTPLSTQVSRPTVRLTAVLFFFNLVIRSSGGKTNYERFQKKTKIFSESCLSQPKRDCKHIFPTDLAPIGIPIGAKSIGKW